MCVISTKCFKIRTKNQGRRDLEAKEALPQGPPENRGK